MYTDISAMPHKQKILHTYRKLQNHSQRLRLCFLQVILLKSVGWLRQVKVAELDPCYRRWGSRKPPVNIRKSVMKYLLLWAVEAIGGGEDFCLEASGVFLSPPKWKQMN